MMEMISAVMCSCTLYCSFHSATLASCTLIIPSVVDNTFLPLP